MKYRIFEIVLKTGESMTVKTPSKITEQYARINAWHYVRRQHNMNVTPDDILDIIGIN